VCRTARGAGPASVPGHGRPVEHRAGHHSTPGATAIVGLPFVSAVLAQDAEDDPLTFSLAAPVANAAIDPTTGVLTFTPSAGQMPSQFFTVVVTDPEGAAATQTFTLAVVANAANDNPVITSSPRLRTGVQHPYAYQTVASDPNADPLTFSLVAAPTGMSIDPSGLILWQPEPGQVGPNAVRVRVEDGRGGVAEQDFTIEVSGTVVNQAPLIRSVPPPSARVGVPFGYDAIAVDPDGDPVVWSLDERRPDVSQSVARDDPLDAA
jgi:hypothetical protein